MPSTHIHLLQVCQKVVILRSVTTCQPVSHLLCHKASAPKGTTDKPAPWQHDTTTIRYHQMISDLPSDMKLPRCFVLLDDTKGKHEDDAKCVVHNAHKYRNASDVYSLRSAWLAASILKPITGHNYWHKSYMIYNEMENRIIESFRVAPNDTSETNGETLQT